MDCYMLDVMASSDKIELGERKQAIYTSSILAAINLHDMTDQNLAPIRTLPE